MITALLVVAYVAFGLGFTSELFSDNSAAESLSPSEVVVVWTVTLVIWPLVVLAKLGMMFGE